MFPRGHHRREYISYTVQPEGEKIQPGSPNILADVLWTGYNNL